MPELIPAAPGSPDLPRVLLDGDGDVWVSWDGEIFHYISRHLNTALDRLTKTQAELAACNGDEWTLQEAEWADA